MSELTAQYQVTMGHSGIGTVEFNGGAQAQNVTFYYKAVPDIAKSNETGMPVKKNTIFVKVFAPGEGALNVVDRPATMQDAQVWPRQWAQFQQNKDQLPEGTHIELLYPTDPARSSTLRANGVHTIEQLANLSAEGMSRIGMGAQQWVNDAQSYINKARAGAGVLEMRRQLEALERDNKALEFKLNRAIEELNRQRASQQLGGQPQAAQQGITLADLQKLLAQSQQQPTMPMAGTIPVDPLFDSATAQINATHPTQEVKKKRTREKL